MKIQPGQCKRCKAVIYLVREAGITWTADMTPLDDQSLIAALVGGQEIYLLALDGKQFGPAPSQKLKEFLSGGRTLLASHPCPTAVAGALLSAIQKAERDVVPGKGPRPSVPPKNRFSGQPRSLGTVPTADRSPSEAPFDFQKMKLKPVCDGCSQPMDDGTYASVELGDILVWAQHVDACP